MGESTWTRATVGRALVIWETSPRGEYAIFAFPSTNSWTVSLQQDGYPLQTVTDLSSYTDARQAVTRLQFKLALGAIDPSQTPGYSPPPAGPNLH